jgi:hypothetical protein
MSNNPILIKLVCNYVAFLESRVSVVSSYHPTKPLPDEASHLLAPMRRCPCPGFFTVLFFLAMYPLVQNVRSEKSASAGSIFNCCLSFSSTRSSTEDLRPVPTPDICILLRGGSKILSLLSIDCSKDEIQVIQTRETKH